MRPIQLKMGESGPGHGFGLLCASLPLQSADLHFEKQEIPFRRSLIQRKMTTTEMRVPKLEHNIALAKVFWPIISEF